MNPIGLTARRGLGSVRGLVRKKFQIWVKTHCARMDHGGCALLVGVKDNEIVQVKGDPEGYLNKGIPATRAGYRRIVSPTRIVSATL